MYHFKLGSLVSEQLPLGTAYYILVDFYRVLPNEEQYVAIHLRSPDVAMVLSSKHFTYINEMSVEQLLTFPHDRVRLLGLIKSGKSLINTDGKSSFSQ